MNTIHASPLSPGRFHLGCNYWASHAGVQMWSRWDEAVVRRDLAILAAHGLDMIRVFPIWPVFQPLEMHRTYQNRPRELQLGGAPLPATPAGRAGMSEEALAHFRTLADIAHGHGITLIVGLVTGWMSGEMYVPQAFECRDPLTDPLAIKWQVRFVRHFVRTLKDHPAIAAWEPGNECNCMGQVADRAQAWQWTNAITAAIRAEDSSRPVASGMHGLQPVIDDEFDPWRAHHWSIQDQGELCDIMTAHPYPHSPSKKPARVDPIGSMRSCFQAVVEARMYSDFGGRPALVEEIGTFGPAYCDEATKAAFLASTLANAWAHGSLGLLWWCAFEQSALEYSPYDWTSWERELGLFRPDHRTPKPLVAALQGFRRFLDGLPFAALPPHRSEAVCIIPRGLEGDAILENAWSVFLLAKQAGFDVRFASPGGDLPASALYLVPGLHGPDGLTRRDWMQLTERARQGATLYVSLDDGSPAPFTELFGLRVSTREERTGPVEFRFDGHDFRCPAPCRLALAPEGAAVLAAEPDGNPAFSRFPLGAGEVFLLTAPIERQLAITPRAFDATAAPVHRLYAAIGARVLAGRRLRSGNPEVTVTEHDAAPDQVIAVLNNNAAVAATIQPVILSGWRIVLCHPAQTGSGITIPAHGCIILVLANT